eukprot:TRINITY_DN14712_c0_g1_i1.p1 TRINITY_DN14712_c0_g1~~TRINITY_DN14712_c0_g1_i1.p1  ORF type:complete len:316 (+),score=73.97 TRINITY_DN14712_c0_g1_i1:103-1050(+)
MTSEKLQTGATRNRTVFFVQCRNDRKATRGHVRSRASTSGREDRDSLLKNAVELDDLEAGGVGGALRDKLPPSWMLQVDDVNYDIAAIKQKLVELGQMHKKHLLPQIEADELGDDEQKVEILTEYITKMFQAARLKAQKVGKTDKNSTADDEDMRRNIQSSLGTQLQELSVVFRKAQSEYLKKLKARSAKGRGVDIQENEDGSVDVQFTQEQMSKLADAEDLVATREKEIRQIAKSINELAAIFRDLATLVIEQGTILDRIDYNVEHVQNDVGSALVELHKAEESQKSSRNKLCMLLLCIGILIVVIIIIFKIIL